MILSLPGWQSSPPGHWQSLWEASLPTPVRRVEQTDWHATDPAEWVAALRNAVNAAKEPTVLLAHSLGALTVVHWAVTHGAETARVQGAFLVTPPDVNSPERCPECLHSFSPVPRHPLPFPTLVIGSENDPYASPARFQEMAHNWGAEYRTAGAVGHINLASGHGPWPEGEELFAGFLARLR